jgi:hypothetical protein
VVGRGFNMPAMYYDNVIGANAPVWRAKLKRERRAIERDSRTVARAASTPL